MTDNRNNRYNRVENFDKNDSRTASSRYNRCDRSVRYGRYGRYDRCDRYDRYDRYDRCDIGDRYEYCDINTRYPADDRYAEDGRYVRYDSSAQNERVRRGRVADTERVLAERRKAKAGHRRLVAAAVCVILAAVISVGALVYCGARVLSQNSDTTPTTAVRVMDNDTAKALSDNPSAAGSAQASAQQTSAQTSSGSSEDSSIQIINGDRVYVDHKHVAPANTGDPAHYNAYGKTSYGFDWDYSADNGNFVLACNYNFDKQQYDFIFYGKEAGTSHVTLYYNTDDNTRVPVQLTVTVDNALNATVAG